MFKETGGQSQMGPTILGDGTPNLAGSPTPAIHFMLRQCIVAAHPNNSRDTISLGFGTMSLLYANATSVVLQLQGWWVGRNSKKTADNTTEGSWLHGCSHLPRDRVSNTFCSYVYTSVV